MYSGEEVRKLIISISIAIVLLSTLYYLVEKNIINLKSTQLRNVIGKSFESEYIEKTQVIALRLRRQIEIEDKKLDFLIKDLDKDYLSKIDEKVTSPQLFIDYINSNPHCTRIRVANRDLQIVYSTFKRDVSGSKLDPVLYGEIFQKYPSNKSTTIVDSLKEEIIFSKSIVNDDSYRILFYYSKDIFDSAFKKIESLDYKGFLITEGKQVLVNFPKVDIGDEKNISDLVSLISEKNSGVVRVLLNDSDKTVYYSRISEPYTDWTVGITLDSKHLKVSSLGTIVLITQAIVVLSVLVFILVNIKQKRGMIARRRIAVPEEEGVAIKVTEEKEVEKEEAVPEPIEEEGEVPPLEVGVISLSDVEEVTELEEIGEAEIAEELTEVKEETEVQDIEEAEEVEEIEDAEEAEEVEEIIEEQMEEEIESTKKKKVIKEIAEDKSDRKKAKKNGDQITKEESRADNKEMRGKKKKQKKNLNGRVSEDVNLRKEEPIEDDVTELQSNVSNFSHSLPELGKLVKAKNDRYSSPGTEDAYGEVEVFNESEEDMHTVSISEEEEEELMEVLPKKTAVKEPIKTDTTVTDIGKEKTPEEAFKEKKKDYRNDELARLIDEIDGGHKNIFLSEEKTLKGIFEQFMQDLTLSKGAVLLKNSTNMFCADVIIGLSEKSRKKLLFDGNEKIFRNILAKGKMLYVREDAFFNNEIRSKFDIFDASKIKSLFFAPIGGEGDIKGIVIVCLTMGEMVATNIITKEINRIKKIISNYI